MKPAGALPFALPGRYAYDNETFAGGQGAVYICRDVNLDRRVAIKVLHTVSNAASLLKEVSARAKIKSKHVAEIYEVLLSASGKPFALILEYIYGAALDDKASIPTAVDAKLLLLYQLACGLSDIHAAGVIHRDIKPQNMKVDQAGILKIFDLGISNLDADAASTVGGAGSYVYRAPELYATAPLGVTRAADVYALGVVAWHIFGNAFPAPLLEIPPQHSRSPLPSLQKAAPDLGSIAALVDQALKVDPKDRPSAVTIRDALQRRITRGKQRGLFAHGLQTWELSTVGKSTTLAVGVLGTIKIAYDGSGFVVREVAGAVFVNNAPAAVNDEIPDSCVLTFGDLSQGTSRRFVTFNASQPEIVL
jgi:serine/threonine protein kinase